MAEAEASRVRNGYDNNGSVPRPAQAARACSYSEFLKCKPLDFKGTEGVVGLTRWFEKMESVFSISNCPATSQVKFATCTLQDDALTWWNSHVKTTTPEVAHVMPWAALKKMMTDKYCPRGEIKKIELKCGTEVRQKEKQVDDSPQNNPNQTTARIGGRTQARPMLQAMVTGSHTKGLSLYVPSVIAIMKQVLVTLGAIMHRVGQYGQGL
ncbi:reverse transcriptase domain-containing protein [Tanacetum coccineum]